MSGVRVSAVAVIAFSAFLLGKRRCTASGLTQLVLYQVSEREALDVVRGSTV